MAGDIAADVKAGLLSGFCINISQVADLTLVRSITIYLTDIRLSRNGFTTFSSSVRLTTFIYW